MRLLNASANVSRYKASGRTQSSGTGATSSNNLLVMERSSMELHAERASHNALSRGLGAPAVSLCSVPAAGGCSLPARASPAPAPHSSTKKNKNADHRAPFVFAGPGGFVKHGVVLKTTRA